MIHPTLTTMKKIITLAIVLCTRIAFAGDNYVEIMQKNIKTVYTASDMLQLQSAVNAFERIGAAEKTKWEPYYFEAFGYVMLSIRAEGTTVKDDYLDRAQGCVDKAKAIAAEESEIVAMEGFVLIMKINIAPALRGPRDSGKAMTLLNKAIALNGDNPRAWALLAQMQFGTAKFLHSSTADACSAVDKSLEKFASFKSDNALAPMWGKGMADDLKAACQKE